MNKKTRSFSLNFSGFSLDFEVWLELSREWTRQFSSHGSDFVFAITDTWLRVGNEKYLIIPEDNPGNFIETLKELMAAFRKPIAVVGIEKMISQGGLHKWMRGYWERLINDASNTNDEYIYNLVAPADILTAHEGNFAVYQYNGILTVEVSAKLETGDFVDVWCEVNAESVVSETEQLKYLIGSVILKPASNE